MFDKRRVHSSAASVGKPSMFLNKRAKLQQTLALVVLEKLNGHSACVAIIVTLYLYVFVLFMSVLQFCLMECLYCLLNCGLKKL